MGDTEGFVNLPLSIDGIVFSVLFTENDNHIKLSLRSKGAFRVNEFSADHFNGGGHKNASGGKSSLDLNDCLAYFESLLPKYQKKLATSMDQTD
jgi:phosphoesterase RecJ-like protein